MKNFPLLDFQFGVPVLLNRVLAQRYIANREQSNIKPTTTNQPILTPVINLINQSQEEQQGQHQN